VADEPERSDLDIEPDDAGIAFRAEMWATDKLMRFWKQIAGAIALFLFGTLVYGQWKNMYQADQRSTTSAIADREESMPQDLASLPQLKAGFQPGQELDEDAIRASADDLLKIASEAKGTAAVEAGLKSAEMYRVLELDDKRREALEVAEQHASGVLRYAAVVGLANLDIENDEADKGLDRFRSLAEEEAYLARQAKLDLAAALEALGRFEEAVVAYDEFLSSFPDAPNVDDIEQRRTAAAGKAG
jgi:tetratricopeptide (TPR) repeat protein